MNQPQVVGLVPSLPWPLSGWRWWTEPVRAERLAALRIGIGVVLIVDVLGQYLPHARDFFGRGSLGSPDVFASRAQPPHWHWSVLRGIEDARMMSVVLIVWALAGLLLVLGWVPRWSALLGWVLSVSVINVNYYLHNSGDRIRTICLFYLMLCPCGMVWSLAGRRRQQAGPIFVSPWALRLLFVQMALIYFFNGFYKLFGDDWRSGDILHYIMGNLAWTRWSHAMLPIPDVLIRPATWAVLAWEVGFPLLVCLRPLRTLTLWIGVVLHVVLGLSLEIGVFSLYMLCLYLPLVPWERYVARSPGKVNSRP